MTPQVGGDRCSPSAALVVAFGMIAPQLGSEFVPRLSEGAIVVNVVRLAGTDLEETNRYNTQMERTLLEKFPDEIAHVWSRVGTAEVATDPMGVELTDMFITLEAARTMEAGRHARRTDRLDSRGTARPARAAARDDAAD